MPGILAAMRFGLWLKLLMVKLHLSGLVNMIEFCKDCGVRQPLVWHASDELWARVRCRETEDDGGVLCPKCFDEHANRMGILLMWRPEIHGNGAALLTRELALDIDYRLLNAQDTYALHELDDAQDEWQRISEARRALRSVFGPLAMNEHFAEVAQR